MNASSFLCFKTLLIVYDLSEPEEKESAMSKRKLPQILRFLLGGAIGVVVYYVVLYVLTEMLGVWYVISAVCAFILNNGINFVIQKFWTFGSKDTRIIPKQLPMYFLMGVCILTANTILLYTLVEYAHLYYMVAQIILTMLLTTASFIVTKRIFKH